MKTAIIGCGAISKVHAEAVLKTNAALCAFCDIDVEKANAMAQKYGGKVYTDYISMLDTEKPDTVHICTPHFLHVEMAIEVLSRGINAVLEKPPAMTKQEFETLEKAVESSKADLTVCFQNRYNLTTDTVREIIADNRYGQIVGARGIVTWNREGDYYTKSDWRGKRKTEGGGVLINQSIHTLDLLNFLLGAPESVTSVIANMTHGDEIDVEDTVCANIRYSGKKAVFFATTSAVKSPAAEITLFFENADVTFDSKKITVTEKNADPKLITSKNGIACGKACWGSSHELLIKRFYEGENPCTLQSCQATMELMSAIYKTETQKPERITL